MQDSQPSGSYHLPSVENLEPFAKEAENVSGSKRTEITPNSLKGNASSTPITPLSVPGAPETNCNLQNASLFHRSYSQGAQQENITVTHQEISRSDSHGSNSIHVSHHPSVRRTEHFRHSSEVITTTHYPISKDTEGLIYPHPPAEVTHYRFEDALVRSATLPSSPTAPHHYHANNTTRPVPLKISQLRLHHDRLGSSLRLPSYHTDIKNNINTVEVGGWSNAYHRPHDQEFIKTQVKNASLPVAQKPLSDEPATEGQSKEISENNRLPRLQNSAIGSNPKSSNFNQRPNKGWITHCASSKARTSTVITLLVILCLAMIGNLFYFVIIENSSTSDLDAVTNTTPQPNVTSTTIHGLEARLSQIQYCGVFPANYIYAFDHEEQTSLTERNVTSGKPILASSGSSTKQTIKGNSHRSFSKQARVVGGKNTPPGTVPWQASLWVKYVGMVCGGSIVMKNWILTAAHCTIIMSDPLGWDVYVGMTKLSEKRTAPGVRKNVIKIIQHEKYKNDSSYDYDIGLLQLETNLEYSEYIQPICIPPQSYVFPDGMPCYVSGWGALTSARSAPDADILQRAQINIIRNETCKLWNKGWVTERMICAGKPQGGRDACEGDSGGPLSCYDQHKDVWMLAGSVSWGEGCGQPHRPGVYAKISYFSEWIWTKIGKEEGWINKTASIPKNIIEER